AAGIQTEPLPGGRRDGAHFPAKPRPGLHIAGMGGTAPPAVVIDGKKGGPFCRRKAFTAGEKFCQGRGGGKIQAVWKRAQNLPARILLVVRIIRGRGKKLFRQMKSTDIAGEIPQAVGKVLSVFFKRPGKMQPETVD